MNAINWTTWNRETYVRVRTEPLSRLYGPSFDHRHRVAIVSLFSVEGLGPRALFSFMKEAGFDVDLILLKECSHNNFKMPTERERQFLIDLLAARSIRTVGLSVRSGYVKLCANLTEQIHETLGIPVVWGGTAATVTPALCIEQGADYAVWNEGEETFAELINALATNCDGTNIKNLWCRGPTGEPVANAVRPLIQNLDALPIQDLEDENKFYINYGRVMEGEPQRNAVRFETMAARGCPYSCSFCIHSTLNRMIKGGSLVNSASVEHVIREVEYARAKLPKLGYIYWADELFGARLAWLREFREQYSKRIALPFFCQMHPSAATETRIRLLKEAGVADLNIGIQSGSERTRKNAYQRPMSNERFLALGHLVKRYNVFPRYDVIVDNPFESSEDKRATLELLLKLPRPYTLNMFSLTFLPGTVLTEQALEQGVIGETDVSGMQDEQSEKFLHQFAMSFDYPRSAEDNFWNALFALSSKTFVPRRVIRSLSDLQWLRRHPLPVVLLARAASLIRLTFHTAQLLCKGRISLGYVRRFLGSLGSTAR